MPSMRLSDLRQSFGILIRPSAFLAGAVRGGAATETLACHAADLMRHN
jgi:hypothetical protein